MPTTNQVNLTGVPETMLWTLHNRANEAKRADALLSDPECVRIYDAITYDYEKNFGKPDASHALRSRLFDDAVKPWMQAHPGGSVVELGVGLETQFQRCDDGQVHWLCVDVPEAIDTRERFLRPSERCKHVRRSALDLTWMDEVDPSRGVFVTAQGLFMYFEEEQVRKLLTAIIDRFPGVEVMFDVIPPWFSKKTLKGLAKTKTYIVPPMPWGIQRDDIQRLLPSWSPRIQSVEVTSYGFARGLSRLMLNVFSSLPKLRNIPPAIVRVRTH